MSSQTVPILTYTKYEGLAREVFPLCTGVQYLNPLSNGHKVIVLLEYLIFNTKSFIF